MLYLHRSIIRCTCAGIQIGSVTTSGNTKLMTQTKIELPGSELAENNSRSLLIGGCINCISQCDQILGVVSQKSYADASKGGATIGAHVRHILDRFHCFFAGLPDAAIDYDARKRDKEIEQNLSAAAFAVSSVGRRIEQLSAKPGDLELIAVKEAVLATSPSVEIASTLERELMGLITHSIHHLAIIVMIAKSFGYEFDADLGKAPSTIAFERG